MEDNIVKFLAYNGRIAITCAETTMLVEKARNTHDLSPVATAALGRLLTMGVIMGSDLKSEKDNITLQIKGDGPIGRMVAVVNKNLQIKGMVENPQVDAPLNEFGKLDVGGVVGYNGYVNVIKDIGLKEPYIGVIPISSGEIAEDFARYFTESEQTRSAVALGVLVDKNGVKKAGGYLLTAMPDATDEDITKIEKSIFEAGAISKMLDDNLSLVEIAKKVTGDKNVKVIQTDMHPIYECDCSKEKIEKAIRAEKLKKEAISDLQSEQQPETYKSRIEACREAILETGKAIFWQKCISRQPEKNDKEVNQMYEVQKKLYVYLDSLEDLKHYAEKKKRIDAEIEKAEEEHAREAALYAQQKKEDALRNAEMMGVIFGAEMEAYLLARDFAEEIKEDPWLYCALTDVDPWLVNIL